MSAPVRIPKSASSPIFKASARSPQSRSSSSSSSASSHMSKHSSSPASSSSSSSSSPFKESSSRRHSRPDLMSSSLRSQDDYLAYEIPSADSETGFGSVVIIPKCSQGFSWNEGASSLRPANRDVFLSKYHLSLSSPKRLSSSPVSELDRTDSENGEFVDVHEIHIDDDGHHELWWDDLP